jgi:hypothetical protein
MNPVGTGSISAGQQRYAPPQRPAPPAANPGFTPTQVVNQANTQSPDMTGTWASDYSRGMAGAGAPSGSLAPQGGVASLAPMYQQPTPQAQPSALQQGGWL